MVIADTTSSTRIVEFLLRPTSYTGQVHHVELVETHISWVFLTERHVFKLKKPVQFEFLDFSTAEARRKACIEEVKLNKRLAPSVYLGILPITKDSHGRLSLDGPGTPVDWVVKMRRLPADRTLETLIQSGRLGKHDAETLASKLTKFFLQAVPLTIRPSEYRQAIQQHVIANQQELAQQTHALPQSVVKRVHAAQRQFLVLAPQLFDDRVCDGRVVDGHGDLRPEHIYLTPDTDVIDCIEFSPEYRQLDVIDELCFLAIECERMGDDRVGQRLLESYCDASGDRPPETLLNFYKSYRACVRAKVAALRSLQVEPPDRQTLLDATESYLGLADRHAALLGPPLTIVVRGLMGTGKSTLASTLAELFGADLLQTDVIRRQRTGAGEIPDAYGKGRYTAEARHAIYDEIFRRARGSLADRLSVVLDGTFLTAGLRTRSVDLARQAGSLPLIVECKCPANIAKQRIQQRITTGLSTSEARADLYSDQQAEQEPDSVGVPSIEVNTTNCIPVQVEAVLSELRRRLA
jgi:aminoglycoside phosphotransferase family enzyme/predicted kinase